ncbi:MAG: hypothetical protein ACLPSO_10810 [Terracidiphilus sp.]
MSISWLLRLFAIVMKSSDLVAFLVAAFIVNLVSSYLPAGAWYNYEYILISYNLFLIWLVIETEHVKHISLPIGISLLTHAVCLVLIVPIGMGIGVIPYFEYLRFCVPVLAYIELKWLITLGVKKKQKRPVSVPVSTDIVQATADDHDAWIEYLSHRDPRLRKPGMSVKEEYEQWLAARAKSRSGSS